MSALFSIAIPSSNRPEVLSDCLRQCLRQTITDFEIIVAENSETPAVVHYLEQNFSDPRLKVIRTGGLDMSANWEAALQHCSGEYLFIISDKVLLHKETLAHFHSGIKQCAVDLFSVSHALLDSQASPMKKADWKIHETAKVTDMAATGDIGLFLSFGLHGYSIVISYNFYKKLKREHGRIAFPVCPDFVLGFMAALSTKEFAFSPTPICTYHAAASSNGISTQLGCRLGQNFIRSLGMTPEECCQYAPIPIFTVTNLIISDFFHVAGILKQHHLFGKLNKVLYWKALHSEIMAVVLIYHLDKTVELRQLYQYLEDNPGMYAEVAEHIGSYKTIVNNEPKKRPFHIKKVLINILAGMLPVKKWRHWLRKNYLEKTNEI